MDGVIVAAALAAGVAVAAWTPGWSLGRLAHEPQPGRTRRAGMRGLLARLRRAPADEVERTAEVSRVCLLLAVCLEAGRPTRSALRVVTDVVTGAPHEALTGVLRQIDLGIDEGVAWSSLTAQAPYRGMARDLARSVHSGVALATLLRQHAVEARRSALSAAQVRARQTGVSGVVPLVICFLPAFVLLGVVPIFGGVLGRLLG